MGGRLQRGSRVLAAGLAVLLSGCGHSPLTTAPRSSTTAVHVQAAALPGSVPRFIIRNAIYRLDRAIGMNVPALDGDLVAATPGVPLDPSAIASYRVQIHQGTALIAPEAIAALFNTCVFNDADSPLRGIKVSLAGDRIAVTGEVLKVLWLPFTAAGRVAVTNDGRIKFTPDDISAAGVPVSDLLDLIGLDVAQFLAVRKDRGVTIDNNDVLVDVAAVMPAPKLIAKVSSVYVSNGSVAVTLDDGVKRALPALPLPNAQNYLAVWGGTMHLGGATLANAELQACDADPTDPLMFALSRLADALAAGSVSLGTDGRTVAYIPDLREFDAPLGHFTPTSLPVPGIPVQAAAGTEN